MANKLRKDVRFRRGQGFGLDDQVVVAGGARGGDQVDADGGRRGAVVGGGEFVNDCGHAIGRVLRCLSRLNGFGWH